VLGHRTLGGSLSYQGMSGHYEATTSAIGIGTPKRLSGPACARFRYIDKRRASYWEKSKAAAAGRLFVLRKIQGELYSPVT
jgi:hypothetical protein